MIHRVFILFSQCVFLIAQNVTDKPLEICSAHNSSARWLSLASTLTEAQEKINVSYYRINIDIDFENMSRKELCQYVEDKFKWQHGDFWNLHSTQKIRVCCQIARNNNFRVGEEE